MNEICWNKKQIPETEWIVISVVQIMPLSRRVCIYKQSRKEYYRRCINIAAGSGWGASIFHARHEMTGSDPINYQVITNSSLNPNIKTKNGKMSDALADPHHKTRRLARRRSQLISTFVKLQFQAPFPSKGSDYRLLFQDILPCQTEGRH